MPPTNWLAIVIATFIPMIVGFIYYHDKVFGNAWMTSLGWTKETMKKGNMAVMFGVSLFMSFLLANWILFNVDGPGQEGKYDTFKHGAGHGVFVTFLLVMPIIVTTGLFERKSFKNMAINIGYWLITLCLMGGVIDAMNHWPADMPPM